MIGMTRCQYCTWTIDQDKHDRGCIFYENDSLKAALVKERTLRIAAENLIAAPWDDKPLPEDAAMDAAHPVRSGHHELYAEAMRLVGACHSKSRLVLLVTWLLSRIQVGGS